MHTEVITLTIWTDNPLTRSCFTAKDMCRSDVPSAWLLSLSKSRVMSSPLQQSLNQLDITILDAMLNVSVIWKNTGASWMNSRRLAQLHPTPWWPLTGYLHKLQIVFYSYIHYFNINLSPASGTMPFTFQIL